MAHFSFWQFVVYCVIAIVTLLPYFSLKSFCANKSQIKYLLIIMLSWTHWTLLNKSIQK